MSRETSVFASALPFTGFRPDIQGLRAIAVGVVLLYHANAPFLPGGFVGVDVFFVISGFLITGLLLREAITTGIIGLADFYARRARRILPAATVVLLATLLLTAVFLPQIRWRDIGIEAVGAAVYVVNWLFAANTDYLNADVAPSPLQHFWTLSVEEQFYIVWPLVLIVLLALSARRLKKTVGSSAAALDQARVLRGAGIGVLVILIPSLAWSVYYTAVNPAPAYFVTTTRLWELAIGAALAIFAGQVSRLPHWLGYTLGWAGLAGILAASLLYTSAAPAFPGVAALLPTLSAAAIIAGGLNGRAEKGVGVLLGLRPMRWIGDISYSLYLWHWPLIVVGTYLLGGELRFRYGLLIVALAVIPSALSYYFIENPFRDWKVLKVSIRRSLWAGAGLVLTTAVAASLLVAAPLLSGSQADVAKTTKEIEQIEKTAASLEGDLSEMHELFVDGGRPVDVVEGGFIPSATEARDDNSVIYENGCHLEENEVQPNGCVFGNAESDTMVSLIGDSHAASWVPTLTALAEEHDWKLISHTKSACSFTKATQGGSSEYTECTEWNKRVLDETKAEKPDLVVTMNAADRRVWDGGRDLDEAERLEIFAAGLHETWSELNDAGVPVLVLRDTPEMGFDVPECVSANPETLTECAAFRSEVVDARPDPEALAVDGLSSAELVDMNDWICPDEDYCSAIVNNVLVWRDGQHLTKTYAEMLAPPLDATLRGTELAADALYE